MKTIIYHRSDFDGIFCREIAKRFLGPEHNYIGWEYGDSIPQVALDEELFILDLSVDGLMDHPHLVWIDHHKTAIEKYPFTIRGIRLDGVATCRLAWNWFTHQSKACRSFSAYKERLVLEPWAVRLAGEYDIWDKRDPDAELFQHGLRSEDLDWSQIFSNEKYVRHLLDQGKALQYAKNKENESIAKAQAFDVDFAGLKFVAINAARYNSFLFTAAVRPEHDGCLGFNWDGKKWKVSLYGVPHKPDVDLSVIAKANGGGGHKQACGFVTDKLPFLT